MGGVGVVGYDVHAHAAANVNKCHAYFARADDPDRLAVEVEADKAVQAEIEVPRPDISLVSFAHKSQQQRHGVLGYGVRRVCGHAHHGHNSVRRLEVDVVVAGAAQSYQLDAAVPERFYRRAVDNIVDERYDGAGAFRHDGGAAAQSGFKILYLYPVLLLESIKIDFVIRLGVKKSDLVQIFIPRKK